MQNFIINGVTFPSECYGKPLRKWGKVVNAKNNAVAKIKAKEKEQESNTVQAIEAPKSVVLPAENTELDLVGVPA